MMAQAESEGAKYIAKFSPSGGRGTSPNSPFFLETRRQGNLNVREPGGDPGEPEGQEDQRAREPESQEGQRARRAREPGEPEDQRARRASGGPESQRARRSREPESQEGQRATRAGEPGGPESQQEVCELALELQLPGKVSGSGTKPK